MADDKDDKLERSPRVACMARRQPNVVNLHRRVEARILYPALGFPEVIGPPVEINRMNGTSSIHLLLLADKADLKPRDVAWHLRYAKLSEPVPRYLDPSTGLEDKGKAGTTPCSFPESEIEVKPASLGPADSPVECADKSLEYRGGWQVTFARGFIRANLSRYVLKFYKDAGLPHLYEVAIYEKATARVPAGEYTLLWNNPPGAYSRKRASYEMERLLDNFYQERQALAKGPKKLPCPPREEYLYEFGEKQDAAHRVEVLHPLFVLDKKPDEIDVVNLADPHLCVRVNTFEEGIEHRRQVEKKWQKGPGFFNNYNTRFEELYAKAQASDVVLITGDIVDYGRGYDGKGKFGDLESYLLDRNWFLFYRLLAGVQLAEEEETEDPANKNEPTSGKVGDSKDKPGEGKSDVRHSRLYTKPLYTVLGNHDWRQDPYGPICSQFDQALDLQLTQDELAQLHGPGASALIYGSTKNVTLTQWAAEWSPILTSLESVKWYLLLVNPFLDYVVRYPGGFCFAMLDWAKEEKLATPSKKKAVWAEREGFLKSMLVGLPVAKASLSRLQKSLVEWFLQLPEGAKAVGLHAPLVGPEGSIGDDDLRMGCLVPCPICNGTGRFNAREIVDGQLRYRQRECQCRPPSGSAPSWLPYRAVNVAPHEETTVPDETMPVHGTVRLHRDWLIGELMRHKVAAAFSGHVHRNTLLRITDDNDWNHPRLPAGCAVMVESLPLSGNARSPVFVNTSSAGPVGWRIPYKGRQIPERSGIVIVRLRFDGVVLSARYEVSPVLKLRAKRPVDAEKKNYEFCDEEYKEPPEFPTNRPLAPSKI